MAVIPAEQTQPVTPRRRLAVAASLEIPCRCIDHLMIACTPENIEDCRPLLDADGDLKTRAPKWFVERANRIRISLQKS